MNFAERLDGLIGAVSPEWGASRKRARLDMLAAQEVGELEAVAEPQGDFAFAEELPAVIDS